MTDDRREMAPPSPRTLADARERQARNADETSLSPPLWDRIPCARGRVILMLVLCSVLPSIAYMILCLIRGVAFGDSMFSADLYATLWTLPFVCAARALWVAWRLVTFVGGDLLLASLVGWATGIDAPVGATAMGPTWKSLLADANPFAVTTMPHVLTMSAHVLGTLSLFVGIYSFVESARHDNKRDRLRAQRWHDEDVLWRQEHFEIGQRLERQNQDRARTYATRKASKDNIDASPTQYAERTGIVETLATEDDSIAARVCRRRRGSERRIGLTP